MKMKGQRLAGFVLCGLLTLAACADAFAQGPRGGGPGGPPPGGGRPPGGGPGIGFPPGGGPPGGGPRRGGEERGRPDGHRPPPPFGPRADMLSSEMRFGDRLVKGAPYSAQFVTESTRTLGDGTRITHKATGTVYRDGEGRTRREQTLAAIGPVAVEGEPRQMVFINDYVARLHYALDAGAHTARRLPLLDAPPAPQGPPPEVEGEAESVKTEALGRRTIEGVEAEGTRTTINIPAGRVGNDRALEIVSERWYSPELQVVVLSTHRDPFAGDNVYRLTNITRSEPAPALFAVPADYSIVEGPPPQNQPKKPRQ
jgi:hypothetical protein